MKIIKNATNLSGRIYAEKWRINHELVTQKQIFFLKQTTRSYISLLPYIHVQISPSSQASVRDTVYTIISSSRA